MVFGVVSMRFGVLFGRFGVVWGISTDPNRLTRSDAGQLVLLQLVLLPLIARSVFKSDKSSRNKSYEIVVLISDGSDSANMKSLLVKVQNYNPSQ